MERRVEAGFQVYRAVVSEGLRRLKLYRESRAFRAARQLPHSTPEQVKLRNAALDAARVAVGLTEQSVQQWAGAGRKESGWIAQHLDATAVNLLAERA